VDAATQPAGRLLQRAKSGVQAPVKGIEVVGSTIGQAGFGIRPHAFIGIEFGGVGREKLEVKPRIAAAEIPNRFAFVDRRIVEENDHVASQMAQQMAEEVADVGVADVVVMTTKVKPHPPAQGADRQSGDDGEAIVAVVVVDPRGLSARRPGPTKRWDQEEPRLVDEDEVRLPARCVFFTCGQRVCFQRAMRSSSRSSARRSGFWTLKPS